MKVRFLLCLLSYIMTSCFTPSEPESSFKPEDLKLSDKPAFAAVMELKQSQVDRDIQTLSYALNHGYGGRKIVTKQLERTLTTMSQIKAPINTATFANQIDEALLTIPDNHLWAKLNGQGSKAREKFRKPGRVGDNAIREPSRVWEVDLRRGLGEDYLYIAIVKFPSQNDPVWQGFLDQVKKKIPRSSFVVLDLRGNGGGDDKIGIELAVYLSGGELHYPIKKQITSQTPESLMIWGNNFRAMKRRYTSNGKPVPEFINDLAKEADAKYALAMKNELPPEKIFERPNNAKNFNETLGYKKNIYILMDGKCASSCESTIDTFEFHPHAKKVGEATGGFIHFGNVGRIFLPESGVEVQIPTHYSEYYDKRFIERTGIKPDRPVPAGTDALPFVVYKLRGSNLKTSRHH